MLNLSLWGVVYVAEVISIFSGLRWVHKLHLKSMFFKLDFKTVVDIFYLNKVDSTKISEYIISTL